MASEPDHSISIRFVPGFVAKNQPLESQAPPVFIRSLTAILGPDDEDRKLCPVRALREYRRRTKPFRPAKSRLFLSYQKPTKEISCASISRWLRSVIRSAYQADGEGAVSMPSGPRAHEIRAWASSLAWAHNVQISKIMDAAYWFNQGTFLDFYLRDVSRLNDDGSRGISSAVVAQQVLSSSTGSSH